MNPVRDYGEQLTAYVKTDNTYVLSKREGDVQQRNSNFAGGCAWALVRKL